MQCLIVAHQSWIVKCSHRALEFTRSKNEKHENSNFYGPSWPRCRWVSSYVLSGPHFWFNIEITWKTRWNYMKMKMWFEKKVELNLSHFCVPPWYRRVSPYGLPRPQVGCLKLKFESCWGYMRVETTWKWKCHLKEIL